MLAQKSAVQYSKHLEKTRHKDLFIDHSTTHRSKNWRNKQNKFLSRNCIVLTKSNMLQNSSFKFLRIINQPPFIKTSKFKRIKSWSIWQFHIMFFLICYGFWHLDIVDNNKAKLNHTSTRVDSALKKYFK